jgi:proline dehydrogenase
MTPLFRQALLGIASRAQLRQLVEEHPAARTLARRFVAGETIEDGLRAAAELTARGFTVSLDHLGEHVSTPQEAAEAPNTYLHLLDEIAARKLRANVSLKLTQLGIDLDEDACRRHLETVVGRAAEHGNFVRIDMESAAYTERTLILFARVFERFPAYVGPVIQSYLYRSEADVRALVRIRARVRLCKGAYAEPPEVAFPEKVDVDANYVRLMEQLMEHGNYPGLATHDERIIDRAVEFAREKDIAPDRFEFQMLYGIRRDLQDRLLRDGYRVRIYVPFGEAWYPYLTRRLAERPANLTFLVGNLAREGVGTR